LARGPGEPSRCLPGAVAARSLSVPRFRGGLFEWFPRSHRLSSTLEIRSSASCRVGLQIVKPPGGVSLGPCRPGLRDRCGMIARCLPGAMSRGSSGAKLSTAGDVMCREVLGRGSSETRDLWNGPRRAAGAGVAPECSEAEARLAILNAPLSSSDCDIIGPATAGIRGCPSSRGPATLCSPRVPGTFSTVESVCLSAAVDVRGLIRCVLAVGGTSLATPESTTPSMGGLVRCRSTLAPEADGGGDVPACSCDAVEDIIRCLHFQQETRREIGAHRMCASMM